MSEIPVYGAERSYVMTPRKVLLRERLFVAAGFPLGGEANVTAIHDEDEIRRVRRRYHHYARWLTKRFGRCWPSRYREVAFHPTKRPLLIIRDVL